MSSRLLERSNLYYALLSPPLRPLVLEASQRRLGGDAGIGAHAARIAAAARPPHAHIRPVTPAWIIVPHVSPRRLREQPTQVRADIVAALSAGRLLPAITNRPLAA